MQLKKLQEELNSIKESSFAKKTDKQLISYEILSVTHRQNLDGKQPKALQIYNSFEYRKCKLTAKIVSEIRSKYNTNEYGKLKLAKEYGISKSVIHRIIKGESWKIDSG
jgi:hypothetical protein